jgi:hypothetical protein
MEKEIIILMAWHNESDLAKVLAFEENKKTFNLLNPEIEIIVVINPFNDPNQAWLSTDLSIFDWYLKNITVRAKRYLIVEWDCWCDCKIESYFERVWDCDLVVPSVKYPERDDWFWFTTIKKIPEKARKFAVGVTPLCGILISDRAMKPIAEESVKPEYSGLNSELRLGTVATMFDFDPIVNPVYTRSIGWRSVSYFDKKYAGLHHPRKTLI